MIEPRRKRLGRQAGVEALIPTTTAALAVGAVAAVVSLLQPSSAWCFQPGPVRAGTPLQESPAAPAEHPGVQRALDWLRDHEQQTIETQIALCEIPAPPFTEELRGAEYRRRFADLGLSDVRVDAVGNVIGELTGDDAGPLVVLSAHLDTVFPPETDVTVRRERGMLIGPGIGDDCRGLAVVVAVAEAMREARLRPAGTILFVGTVGEEGPGNLRGMRHLFAGELRDQVDYFISVDGAGLGATYAAVGSNRYEVTYSGPGGHSYGNFGMPSPIHAVGRAIAKISEFEVPANPKTTFNVGLIEGGTSVNSIAFAAQMTVDLRSEDPEALAAIDAWFREAVQEALDEENRRGEQGTWLSVDIASIGVRPAGTQPLDAPIVRATVGSAQALGFEPRLGASSTDSNIPISLGIPAITIDGGGSGRLAHSPDESFDPTDSHLGTQWALLLTMTLAGVR